MSESIAADDERLQRWSERHAVLMVIALVALALEREPMLAAALAGGSFLGLILRFRGLWTPTGGFGVGNAITLLRFLGSVILLLGFGLKDIGSALLALALLAADGVDGWAARRQGLASSFGRVFDQEADAWFLVVLCMVLYDRGQFGAWVLWPGALRYIFVGGAKIAGPPRRIPPANPYTRALGLAAMLMFTACLLPLKDIRVGLAAAATLILFGSFGYSTWRLYRPGS